MNKRAFLTVATILLLAAGLFSQVPQKINYQGSLTDETGAPITDNVEIVFSIYENETATVGEVPLWTETQTVTVTNGIFNVLLGSVTPIPYDIFNGHTRYLGIKIGDDDEMTPRKKLTSVPNSYRAYNADKLDNYHASAFLRQVDGVAPNGSGNVDLVAGSNVTITPNAGAHTVTISSTGGGSGDNLGNHTATQNIKLNGHWLSGDGGNEGVFVSNSGNVGIGEGSPNNKLEVNGKLKTVNFQMLSGASSGKVLTSDGSGNGSWQTVSGDNLGNHTATQNIKLNNHYLSNDGGNEGIKIDNSGKVSCGAVQCNGTITGLGDISALGKIGSTSYIRTGTPSSSYGTGDIASTDDIVADGMVYGHGQSSSYGVYGKKGSNYGYLGSTAIGAYGRYGSSGPYGYLGSQNYGVYGRTSVSSGKGVYGYTSSTSSSSNAVRGYAGGSAYAGYFNGKVYVSGRFDCPDKHFKIDHPLDPENKYLSHSSVESDEQGTLYSGNVILDNNGEAVVNLPDWFQALNTNFRYQLTCIGGFSRVYIAEEIADNQFKIAGGKAGMKISWQVMCTRQDAYVKAHPLVVEEAKPPEEKGTYLHPVEHGVSETLGVDYKDVLLQKEEDAHIQEMQRQIDEQEAKNKQEMQQFEQERRIRNEQSK